MTSVSNASKQATWHTIVLILDASIVTIMVTSQWIALTNQHLGTIATSDIPTMTHRDRHRFGQSQSWSHNPRYRSNSHSDSCRSHSRSFHWPSCHSSLCHRSSNTYHYCHDTPHCISSSCRHFPRDDSRSRTHKSNKQHYKPAQRSSSSSQSTPWKPKDRRHKQVTIDDPPSEYYSLDEQDSDSEDDLN